MKIDSQIPSLTGRVRLSPELEQIAEKSKANETSDSGFGDILLRKIENVDEQQKVADKAISEVATGKSRNLHEAVLALEMADTSLKLMVTVRNKAIEAYQEVMRMQI